MSDVSTNLRYTMPVSEHLLCSICHDVLLAPKRVLPCCHSFCGTCIAGWMRSSSSCPLDRIFIQEVAPTDPIVRGILDSLLVACEDCSFSGPRSSHLSDDGLPLCKALPCCEDPDCGFVAFSHCTLQEHHERVHLCEWREPKRHDAATGQPAFMQYQSPMGYLCWRQVSGMMPQDAIQLGRDSDGAPLYAARTPLMGGWQVGKCREAGMAYIPYGGEEMYITSDIQVLCGHGEAVATVPQAGYLNLAGLASMPLDSGHEENGERLYVAVVDYRGSVQVGKCRVTIDGCNFSYGGFEKNRKNYRVVCMC
ncbi:hypothetical protein HDU84_003866 [Entophlyctis sp. JEL0112]|nr:hypothetical protein HDU84_003866 [Entophlyctis sp. JEL0112]